MKKIKHFLNFSGTISRSKFQNSAKTLLAPQVYPKEHTPESLVGKRGGTAKVWSELLLLCCSISGSPTRTQLLLLGERRSPWRHLAKKMCIFITRRITLTSSRLHLRIFPWAEQGEMFINSGNVNNRKENKLFLKKRFCSKLTGKRLAERDNRARKSEYWIQKIF